MSEENTSEHSYRFAYGVGATNVLLKPGIPINAAALSAGQQVIFFWARIVYVDAFGEERQTRVGYRWFSNPANAAQPGGYWQAGHPLYNLAT
jgi:hypothetical protein